MLVGLETDLRVKREEIVVSWSSRRDIKRLSSREVMGLEGLRGEGRVVAVDEGVGGMNTSSGLSRKPPPSCAMISGLSTRANLCDV
jgi:hypothetical protein